MIVPAPPPALTCRLPGPWQVSQPMSTDFFGVSLPCAPVLLTISLVVCSRAWVAVRKSRTICSWQVAHSSEPTNSAPGMLGGARIVRLVVLQESRITASATAPPAPHNRLSRLPWIHRVSLACHTNGEYAQRQKNLTTHFFRKEQIDSRTSPVRSFYSVEIDCTICLRGFPGERFKNSIELRMRSESDH